MLRHPERIGTAVVCAALLVFMVKELTASIQGQDVMGVLYMVVFWGTGILAVCFALIGAL